MTTLVTGGAGYVGSHVVLALRAAGRAVVVIDDLRIGDRAFVPPDVPLVQGDVGDRTVLDHTFATYPVSAVIHLAASTLIQDSLADPKAYYRNNVINTQTLIDACLDYGVDRFVFASTAAVYGASGGTPVDEDRMPQPISPYGATKLLAERIVGRAGEHGLSYAILRCFNVAGVDPSGRAGRGACGGQHLIQIACDVAQGRRDRLTIFGTDYPTADGTGVRDYLHVSDLADAHRSALEYVSGSRRAVLFNVGYGKGHSVLEVIAAVESATGNPIPLALAGRRQGDAAIVVANADRLKSTLGWRPEHDDLGFIVRTALAMERCAI
jgi:UDP-glucose 4-epimerase